MAKIKLFKLGEYWYACSRMDYFTYFYKGCEFKYDDGIVYQKISKEEMEAAWEIAQFLYPTLERQAIEKVLKTY